MSESEAISRRKALSLMGLAAAFSLAAAPTVLAVSDAEAETVGMERRHERREHRRSGVMSGANTAISDVRSGRKRSSFRC